MTTFVPEFPGYSMGKKLGAIMFQFEYLRRRPVSCIAATADSRRKLHRCNCSLSRGPRKSGYPRARAPGPWFLRRKAGAPLAHWTARTCHRRFLTWGSGSGRLLQPVDCIRQAVISHLGDRDEAASRND